MARHELKIFFTFFIVFLYFAYWASWNEESRLALTRAIVDEGRLEIDSFHNQTGDRVVFNDHYYTDKAPGTSLLAVPIYTTCKLIYNIFFLKFPVLADTGSEPITYYIKSIPLTYSPDPGPLLSISMFLVTAFTSSFFSALTVLLIYKISKYFTQNEKHRLLPTLTYGLGTLAFPSALVFTGHGTGTFFGIMSFYLLFSGIQKKMIKKQIFLAGLLSGFGVAVEYPIILIVFACFSYLFLTKKDKTLIFLLGNFLGILILLSYNHIVFGNPMETQYFRLEPTVWGAARTLDIYRVFNFRQMLSVFLRTLIFPEKGLFFYHPILILSFVGLFYMYKKFSLETILIFSLFVLFWLLISTYSMWWGGFSGFGLQHLLPVVPFLIIPLTNAFKIIDLRVMVIFLCISIFVNFLLLQFGEDAINTLSEELYAEKLDKFQIMSNPLINHYWPLFLQNGPRSILFENLLLNRKIDIRNTPHSCGLISPLLKKTQIPLFSLYPIGIATLKIPFLSLVLISIIVFLVWRKEIFKKINLNLKHKLLILLGLTLLFSISFIGIAEFLYGENWHVPEWHDGKVDVGRWMSQDATLILFYTKDNEMTLKFDVESFYKPRTLELYLNDKLIDRLNVYNHESVNYVLKLKVGENILKFHSMEGCDIPTELGLSECDLRCLSFKIGNIRYEN